MKEKKNEFKIKKKKNVNKWSKTGKKKKENFRKRDERNDEKDVKWRKYGKWLRFFFFIEK